MAKSAFTAVLSVIDRVSAPLKKLERQLRPFKRAFKDIGDASAGLQSSLRGIAGPLAIVFGAAGLGSIGAIGTKIVGTSAQFEKFQTVLETIEGSSEKAKASMDWVADFAAKTPYELNGVTDAFVKLKAYGIDPQTGALRSAGDAAAAMGKPLEQAVEALADAMTGENERLKEFGITTEKAGDDIVYRWQQNGKAMVATAKKNSRDQIQSVIQGIWNSRYGGAMDKLSGTWDGMWSNLQDTLTKFYKMIGDAGIFEELKGELGGVLETLDQMASDGSLQAFAQAISDELVSAFRELKSWVMAVDWKAFWLDLKAFAGGVASVVSALGGLKGIAIIIAAVMGVQVLASIVGLTTGLITLAAAAGPALIAIATGFKALLLATGPIGMAIALIAYTAYVLYEHWDSVGPWFAQLWESITTVLRGAYEVIAGILTGDFGRAFDGFMSIGQGMYQWFATMLEGLVGAFNWALGAIQPILDVIGNGISQIGGFIGSAGDLFSGDDDGDAPAVAPASGGGGSPSLVSARSNKASGQPVVPPRGAFGAANRQSLNGELVVRFENTPPGTRVESGKTNQPGMALEADVGYRSLAMP